MKTCSVFLILLTMFVVSVGRVHSQTNSTKTLILPPPDWDAKAHTLASLLATNRLDEYRLPATWAGWEKVTFRAGGKWTSDTNTWLAFDTFRLHSKAAMGFARAGTHVVYNGKSHVGAGHVASLPSDSELMAIKNIAGISNFFGFYPFGSLTNSTQETKSRGVRSSGVRFFALRPYDAIDTVYVEFTDPRDGEITGPSLIRRARLHIEPGK